MKNETAIIKYLKVARTHYEKVILYTHEYSETLTNESIKEIKIINKIIEDLQKQDTIKEKIKGNLENLHEEYNQHVEDYKNEGEEDFNCWLDLFKEVEE